MFILQLPLRNIASFSFKFSFIVFFSEFGGLSFLYLASIFAFLTNPVSFVIFLFFPAFLVLEAFSLMPSTTSIPFQFYVFAFSETLHIVSSVFGIRPQIPWKTFFPFMIIFLPTSIFHAFLLIIFCCCRAHSTFLSTFRYLFLWVSPQGRNDKALCSLLRKINKLLLLGSLDAVNRLSTCETISQRWNK